MARLFSGFFKWLLRHGLLLLLILVGLFAWARFDGEWRSAEKLKRERAVRVAERDLLAAEIQRLNRKAAERAELVRRNTSLDLDRMRAERQALWDGNPWSRYVPLSDVWQKIKLLDELIAAYQTVFDKARLAEAAGGDQVIQLQQALDRTIRQIEEADRELAKSLIARIEAFVRQELSNALMILAGVIFLPLGIKAFLYFCVAPLAASRPPIRLFPSASGRVGAAPADGAAANGGGRVSAVSIAVVLGESQELLIRPEYLQSTSLLATKNTKWLLNPRIPFSSLLSGMFMLTRVGPAGSEPVVISAKRDPLAEVGIVDLAEGAAFVCQPRALAGVVQDRGKPVGITRHWRLGSLHGWLTLQLRFLVFHGPGQLVLKGCRGIRMEKVGAARLINQAATLGFSADVSYANTRCETFMSYWTGKEELFNDLFAGGSGVYVYEETPDLRRATGIGRHFEGLTDAILKAFGI